MRQEQKPFGTTPEGGKASLFILSSSAGITAGITDYGGRIVSLEAPDRSGKPGEIGIGFTSLDGYVKQPNYCGALVGRVANRIRGGRFIFDGKEYSLPMNSGNGKVHLHGGKQGFSFRLWQASEEGGRLRLDYHSPDGEEGYPGNLETTVWYGLDNDELSIEYKAATDRPTLVNLTNHAFFNLNGFKRDVLAHELRIGADACLEVDETLVPTGNTLPVQGTPFDFNSAKPIGRDIDLVPGGYDISYIFSPGKTRWLAEAYDPDSGRTLEVATDQPCLQFYSGNFLDGTLAGGLNGARYPRRSAFCLEAQKHPDAINHPNLPPITLRPGDTYRQKTVYRLGVRKG